MKILKFLYKHKRIVIYLLCAFLVVCKLVFKDKYKLEFVKGDGDSSAYLQAAEGDSKSESGATTLAEAGSDTDGSSGTESDSGADSSSNTEASSDTENGKINLNTASSEELQTVKGIGPVMASKIIAYRESYGNFTCVDELIEVNGIGEKTLEKFRPYFFVE